MREDSARCSQTRSSGTIDGDLPAELEKREKERKNRCVGSAKASYEYLYPKTGYDLVLNTFELTAAECVRSICKLL